MGSDSFAALPMHDATLRSIETDWGKKRCRFHLSAFTASSGNATPHVLEFEGVSFLSLPHSEPWGPSSCVNSVSSAEGRFKIEMQSGDVIELTADGYAFSAL